MKNNHLFNIAIAIAILFSPISNFGQMPDLGTAANFVLFTTTGAVASTGISEIAGDVGSGTGSITGFGTLNGLIYNSDAVTTQATTDLTAAYNDLSSRVPTFFPGPVLGNGQTFTAGVYFLPAAASLNANLFLDAEGDSNAIFVFQIGGAYSTNASSQVFLINGALASHVFWVVNGAVPMAAGTVMRGTIIANNAAVSMGAGGLLEGRMLSTTGAVSIYGSVAFINMGSIVLPIGLTSFTGVCDEAIVLLNWSTASEADNHYFTVERSTKQNNWQEIKTVIGADNSSLAHDYSYSDLTPADAISYYRLKQTGFDGITNYGNTIQVKKCGANISDNLTLYPNPSVSGKFTVLFTGDKSQVISTEIFNTLGQKVSESAGFQPTVDLSCKGTGVYFIKFHMLSKNIDIAAVVKK